jgi:hypothetical protein
MNRNASIKHGVIHMIKRSTIIPWLMRKKSKLTVVYKRWKRLGNLFSCEATTVSDNTTVSPGLSVTDDQHLMVLIPYLLYIQKQVL